MYHVYVDGFLRTTVKASDKTKALVEGVDSHRVTYMIPLVWSMDTRSFQNTYGQFGPYKVSKFILSFFWTKPKRQN